MGSAESRAERKGRGKEPQETSEQKKTGGKGKDNEKTSKKNKGKKGADQGSEETPNPFATESPH